MGSQHIFIEQLLVTSLPLRTHNSWFSPLHVLIIEYLSPISVFATLCLLALNTAQVCPIYIPTNRSYLSSYPTLQHNKRTKQPSTPKSSPNTTQNSSNQESQSVNAT